MNAVERIRRQLWAIQAASFAERIRRELELTPGDPDLCWALDELLKADTPGTSPQRRMPRDRHSRGASASARRQLA